MAQNNAFASLLADAPVLEELQNRLGNKALLPAMTAFSVPAAGLEELISPPFAIAGSGLTEAIVREFGRPSLLIKNGTFTPPESGVWRARLQPTRSKLESVLGSVGRVEFVNHFDYEWGGTGWMVAENVIVTNRHVALLFARVMKEGNRRVFGFAANQVGQTIGARIDFREEYQQQEAPFEVEVEKILFVAEEREDAPDLALLQVKSSVALPPPIQLAEADAQPQQLIAVVGYPARDDRNGATAMGRIFGDIFEVKRCAPGMVMALDTANAHVFAHDCSTLGGNSGSPVFDLETGHAVGLHFAGQFRGSNFAVRASAVRQALQQLSGPVIPVPALPPAPDPSPTPAPVSGDLSGRAGYQADFLGHSQAHKVSWPTLDAVRQARAASLLGQPGQQILAYQHFSLVMDGARRLPMLTAVNIDGTQLRRIPRGNDKWFFDPRISREQQTGDELYSNNDYDRGHMVRRLDPVWGSLEEAQAANDDTFHFTNATPQHKDLNQREWNDLEEHILDNAGAHRLRLTVFTGPVLADNDPLYRGVKIPQEFWKVVVMVRDADTAAARKLSATAYLLSQRDIAQPQESAFVFGPFRTYQVALTRLETLTGLDFGTLRNSDPLRPTESKKRRKRILEGVATNFRGEALRPDDTEGVRALRHLDDIVY